MESKLAHCLKYKVTKLQPAIFADNMTKVIMSAYSGTWEMKFGTKDSYENFLATYGLVIFIDIEDIIRPWYESLQYGAETWISTEDSFSKLLYFFKTRFYRKSDDDAKLFFLDYCSMMLYFAAEKYVEGMKTAPTMAFLEVYNLACHYLERTNYKYDIISILNEHALIGLQ